MPEEIRFTMVGLVRIVREIMWTTVFIGDKLIQHFTQFTARDHVLLPSHLFFLWPLVFATFLFTWHCVNPQAIVQSIESIYYWLKGSLLASLTIVIFLGPFRIAILAESNLLYTGIAKLVLFQKRSAAWVRRSSDLKKKHHQSDSIGAVE